MKLKDVFLIDVTNEMAKLTFELEGKDIKKNWRNRNILVFFIKTESTKFSAGATLEESKKVWDEKTLSFDKHDKQLRKINKEIKEKEQEIIELLKKEKHVRVKLLVHGFLK